MSNPTPDTVQITQTGSLPRDANDTAIQYAGAYVNNVITLTGNGTTVNVPVFHVNGSVLVTGLWGVVTTALLNNTAAYWRLNDQTTQSNITLNTGTALTNAVVGATIVKNGLAAAALVKLDATQERVSEPTTLETLYFSPFVAVQKTGGIRTDIEFTYTTSDTPTSGVIQFFASYIPLSVGASLTQV